MSAQVRRERARERPRESAFAGAMALQPREKAARQRREKAVGTLNELAASLDGEPPDERRGTGPPMIAGPAKTFLTADGVRALLGDSGLSGGSVLKILCALIMLEVCARRPKDEPDHPGRRIERRKVAHRIFRRSGLRWAFVLSPGLPPCRSPTSSVC